jgi:hypothetical protein
VNQAELSEALSGQNQSASVPLISSWESEKQPKVPPLHRIHDIATFFATPRSVEGKVARLLSADEMTVQEKAAEQQLLEELTRLRSAALEALGVSRPRPPVTEAAVTIAQSLSTGLYRFREDENITIFCAQLPQKMMKQMPYTDPRDPDFVDLYRYSDLDSLLEMFGHLRASNPTNRVRFRAAGRPEADDLTANLVSLGGVDWNDATSSVLADLLLPVKQISRLDEGASTPDEPEDAYFEVTEEDGRTVKHRPLLEESGSRTILKEDVALFARAVSPFNRKRLVTICNGMYGLGTYGAVRALTDERFRDRNMGYIRERFAGSAAYCILTRVKVSNGVALTPDWTLPETRLFEWSKSA